MTDTNIAEAAPESGGIENHIESLLSDMTTAEPEAKESEPQAEEKPKGQRDDKGRFVKKEAEEPAKEAEAPKDEPKEHTKVSHAALHEERERRKEEKRLREQAETELRQLRERIMTQQPAPQPVEEDPLAKLERVDRELRERDESDKKARQQAESEQQLINRYRASAQAFVQDRPDFLDAYNYLLQAETKALSRIYRDPAKLNQKLMEYEKDLVNEAYANEENPASVLYEIAKERGYGRKEGPAPVAPQAKVEQLDKGLSAAKSLGSGGGKPDAQGLDLEDLASLSNEEFNQVWKEYEKRAKKGR